MTAHRVDLEQLQEVITELQSFSNAVDEAVGQVDARVNSLHATWSGAAAAEHRAAHARWAQGAREVHEALVVLHAIGTGAHANYTAAVEANMRMWRR